MTTETADSLNGTWKMKSPQIDTDIQYRRNTNIIHFEPLNWYRHSIQKKYKYYSPQIDTDIQYRRNTNIIHFDVSVCFKTKSCEIKDMRFGNKLLIFLKFEIVPSFSYP